MSGGACEICFLNGEYVPLLEARISVLDRGFIFGDAVYEVIPVFAGKLFAGDEHLQRLHYSLTQIGISNPMSSTEWGACLERLIAENGGGDLSVYVQVTRGVAIRDHAIPVGVLPTTFAMCRRLETHAGVPLVRAITREDNRWGRCDIKSTSLLPNVLLRNEAEVAGAYEALLIRDGCLTEGAGSNVFVVADRHVRTPPLSTRLLAGVSRGIVLRLMKVEGIAVSEVEITAAELLTAEEIWVTSSTREISCIYELDGVLIGDGQTYPVAQQVCSAFRDYKHKPQ